MLRRADLHESNHQLESRVREIRLPGSEGGAILISRPYPYPRPRLYTLILDCLTESILMTGLDADKFDALEIRPFQPNDSNQVTGLWHSCNLIRPWNDPKKDIARKLRVNPEWFLVAILGKEIVGSIMVGYERHRGWINYLAVAAPFRSRGIGTQMMERAEVMLRAAGAPKSICWFGSATNGSCRGFTSALDSVWTRSSATASAWRPTRLSSADLQPKQVHATSMIRN